MNYDDMSEQQRRKVVEAAVAHRDRIQRSSGGVVCGCDVCDALTPPSPLPSREQARTDSRCFEPFEAYEIGVGVGLRVAAQFDRKRFGRDDKSYETFMEWADEMESR